MYLCNRNVSVIAVWCKRPTHGWRMCVGFVWQTYEMTFGDFLWWCVTEQDDLGSRTPLISLRSKMHCCQWGNIDERKARKGWVLVIADSMYSTCWMNCPEVSYDVWWFTDEAWPSRKTLIVKPNTGNRVCTSPSEGLLTSWLVKASFTKQTFLDVFPSRVLIAPWPSWFCLFSYVLWSLSGTGVFIMRSL